MNAGMAGFLLGVIATFQRHAVDRNNFNTIIFGHKVVNDGKEVEMVMVKHKREDDERVRQRCRRYLHDHCTSCRCRIRKDSK
jgi:hypothetical protein